MNDKSKTDDLLVSCKVFERHCMAPPKGKKAKKTYSHTKVKLPSKSDKYIPSDKEEYLSAAIQEQECLSLTSAKTADVDANQITLLSEGVILLRQAVPITIVENFLNEVESFSGEDDSLIGLQDLKVYEGPECISAINWKKISKTSALKELLKYMDIAVKNVCKSANAIPGELFLRCTGKGFSTVGALYRAPTVSWRQLSL